MNNTLKWIPYKVYEGMRLVYNYRKMNIVDTRSMYATAHRTDRGWCAVWDHGWTSHSGETSGIKDDAILECWLIVEPSQTQQHTDVKDIKNHNTKPNSTNCIKCNGPLKDIGMGPAYKYCPICEP